MKKAVSLVMVLVMLAAILAACGPTAEPQIVEVVVTKEVEKTVVETVEVEKTVVETVEVEVEKEVTPVPEAQDKGKTLRIIKMEPNVGFNPGTANTSLSLEVLPLLHDPLWEYNEKWEPIPWIAESWDTNSDATEWTFHIKDGLAFTDGSPLTAEDVAYSIEYLAASPAWKARLSVVDSVEAPDASTVVVKMTRPVPEFLQLPAELMGLFIFSKAACGSGGCGDFTVPGVVTSGPWMLSEYILKDHMTLVRNPHYGFEGLPKFDRVEFMWTGDRAAAVAAVEAGQADFTQPVNAPDAALLVDSPNVEFFVGRRVDQFVGWGMDKSKPPFSDKRVRQALGYALEPEETLETCWYGFSSPLWGGYIYEHDSDWYPSLGRAPWKDKSREDRLAIADELLTEAGWVDADGDGTRESQGIEGLTDGTPFSFVAVYEKPWVQAECHALLDQEYWSEIGIEVELQGLPKTNYWPDVRAGKFQMWHIGTNSSPLPWAKLQTFWHPEGSGFEAVVREYGPEAEKLRADIDAIVAEQDPELKTELMSDFVDYIVDQQFFISDLSQDTLQAANANIVDYFALWNGSPRPLVWSDIPDR